jgi:hypothetical protein
MTLYLNNNECVFDNLVIIKNELKVTVLKKICNKKYTLC